MTDSLKFGPEWLRNMKPENGTSSVTTSVMTPIKMAEFRYGREEMLALFDRTILAPDPLKQIQGLHVEKTQPPLALIQMTDEETRMWNRGINSDAVLRLTTSKPGGPSVGPGAPGGGMRGGVLGGRGGSVDRGRGRARGTYHYSRGVSHEDSEGFSSSGSYSRNIRNFDRTQSQNSNQWSERNGVGLGVDHGDWSGGNMSTSPRKEYSGRSMSDTNWRRHRGAAEEEEGWRSTKQEKWTRSTSWRDGESNWETNRGSSGPIAGNSRKPWEPEDTLPEWATENPSESGGSFDASGAFHGGGVYSDEDEDVNHTGGPARGEPARGSQTTTNHKPTSPGNRETSSNIVNGTSQIERIADREKSSKTSSSGPGLRQSQSASSLSSSTNIPERKTSVPARSSTSANLSVLNTKTKPEPCEKVKEEEKVPEPLTPAPNIKPQSPSKSKSFHKPEPVQPVAVPSNTERSEEAMLRMQEAADDLVAKLMEDEEKDLPKPTNPTVPQNVSQPTPSSNTALSDTDKWFYRDPQGTVQGPFLSTEMAEWFKSGYFNLNLQLRRACDERYSPLGELITLWGHVPFLVNSSIPPIKANDNLSTLPTIPVPSTPAAPKPIDEALILQQQYQQYQQQRQQMLFSQQTLFKQLAQSDRFNALTPLEQQQVLLQHTANLDQLSLLTGYLPPPPPTPTPTQPHPNTQGSVIAMIQQIHLQHQQQQAQVAAGIVPEPTHTPLPQPSIDPLQLIQSIGLQAQSPLLPQPQMHQKQLDDQRGMEQLRTLFANVTKTSPLNAQPPPPRSQTVKQVESVWGGTAATGPSYSPNWPLSGAPPPSLWGELHTKGMKTEQEVLEEQLRAEEERKKEERRKQEELQRLKEEMEEEERARRRREEEEAAAAALERKRKEDEERERRRLKEEEERKKQEAAARKAEQERLKKEEEKKRKEEEKRRKEEQKRKQEEEKRKQEEERKRLEEERKKQEEETKRAEQAKRQAEALKRLQEQQQQAQARAVVKPSTTPAWTPTENAVTSTSLTEIQKTERKQQQQLREQQQLLQLIQQQQQQQERNNNKSGNSLNLKWADTKKPQARVKSLAEIQAEEQEQLAKQTEREKAERMAQAKEVPLPAASSIWANQNLTWNTQSSGSVWGNTTATGKGGISSGPGFWEEVVPPSPAPNKAASKSKSSNTGGASSVANKPAVTKNRAKKEEMTVLKLFEQQPKDEFYIWCSKTLSTMQSSVDIPTFVQFLREIEHPFEVQEYIRIYLGEGKDALDFASQFIDRRSRAKSGEPQKRTENSTTSTTNHFQEVKGKNKKVKKGKMLRVDNRILGFSVTASQDRFNVGDRDYGENI